MAQPVSRAALARLAPQQRWLSCICPLCARETPTAPIIETPVSPTP